MKWLWFIALFSLFLSCNPPVMAPSISPTSTPPTPEVGKSNLVFSLSGSSGKTSEVFYITSKDWYVDWTYQETSGFGSAFFVWIYSENAIFGKDNYIDSIAVNAPGADRIYIHNQIGGFYIVVTSVNAKWEIKVYE